MVLNALISILLFATIGCGIPGRPLPPLDRETIGHGFPKKNDDEKKSSLDKNSEKSKKDDNAPGNP